MASGALALIGLRPGEGARTTRLIAFAFLLTAGVVLLKTAQRGLFLCTYPSARIPDAFMASAAALAVASLAASALAPRLGIHRLVVTILVGAIAALAGARVALTSTAHGVPFAIYVVAEVISGLLLVQGWGLITEALDVRSAKRLLPLVGVGAGLAWVLGGLGTGALARLLGAPNLLLVSIALLGGAGVALIGIGRRDLGDRPHAPAPRVAGGPLAGIGDAISYVLAAPLLRLLAVMSVLDLLVEQVIDYQLFAAAQQHFGEPEALAAFMGQLYAITGVATVLAPLLVSGRLLARFGSTRCLLAAQLWELTLALVIFGVPGLAAIAALSAGDRMLKQSLSSPGRAQMQAPLPAWRRAQAGALIRGVLAPLFYVAGGAALKLLPTGALRWPSLAVVALVAGLLIVTARLGHAYVRALRASLDHRQLELDAAGPDLGPEHIAALAEQLAGDAVQAGFAVTLLAGAPAAVARPALARACAHPAPEVRAAAIETLAGFACADDADVIVAALERASEDDVERACLRALARLEADVRVRDAVRARHADPDPRVRALACASLARAEAVGLGSLHWAGGRAQAHAVGAVAPESRVGRFVALLQAAAPDQRAAAVWALGEVRPSDPAIDAALLGLLEDPVVAVQIEALRAAGKLGLAPYVAPIVRALGDARTRPAAIEATAALDDRHATGIERSLVGAPVLALTGAASALALGAGPAGDAVLGRLLDHPHPAVRYRAARALAARHHGAVTIERLAGLLDREVAIARPLRSLADAVPGPFLRGELIARLRQCEKRGLALVALACEPALCHLVESRARGDEPRARAQAIELIEAAVPAPLAPRVVALFEGRAPAPVDAVAAIVALDDIWLRQAAAIELAGVRALTTWNEDAAMLSLVETVYFLRSVPLFRELSGEDLLQIARIAAHRELPAGAVLFRKGEPGDAMYVVARGRVRVADGGRELAVLGREELVGELALLDGEARSADAECLEACELLGLARADLDELLERRPEIGRGIIQVLVRRLRAANQR
jgi:HEAT repeat protein